MGELPVGHRIYMLLTALLLPVGAFLLIFAGAVVPGLILLALDLLTTAVLTPILIARGEKRERERK